MLIVLRDQFPNMKRRISFGSNVKHGCSLVQNLSGHSLFLKGEDRCSNVITYVAIHLATGSSQSGHLPVATKPGSGPNRCRDWAEKDRDNNDCRHSHTSPRVAVFTT